eukprot:6074626-Pleurochrysis_carterae.AAC.1
MQARRGRGEETCLEGEAASALSRSRTRGSQELAGQRGFSNLLQLSLSFHSLLRASQRGAAPRCFWWPSRAAPVRLKISRAVDSRRFEESRARHEIETGSCAGGAVTALAPRAPALSIGYTRSPPQAVSNIDTFADDTSLEYARCHSFFCNSRLY